MTLEEIFNITLSPCRTRQHRNMGAWASRSSNDLGDLATACACAFENSKKQPADASAFRLVQQASERTDKLGRCESDETFTSRKSTESGASEPRSTTSDQQLDKIEGKTRRLSLSRAKTAHKEAKVEFDERKKRTSTSPSRLATREKRSSVSPSRQSADGSVAVKIDERKHRTSMSPARVEEQSPSQLGRSLRSSVSPSRQSSVSGARMRESKCVRPGFGETYSTDVYPSPVVRSLSAWSRNLQ
jgi:hypothetical protein